VNPPTFAERQGLGARRGDILLLMRDPNVFPYVWLLTQDSKASPLTRLIFAMKPWYAVEPRQLDGLRVATVADPVAVSRAWALQLLAGGADTRAAPPPPESPRGRRSVPWPGRSALVGPRSLLPPGVHEAIFLWARSEPAGLRAAAQAIAERRPGEDAAAVERLLAIIRRLHRPDRPGGRFSERLLEGRPQALVEAVEILIRRPDAVRSVLTRFGYTDPATIGGFLDRDLPGPHSGQERGATASVGNASVPPRSASTRSRSRGPTTTRASNKATVEMAQASQ